MIRLALEAAGFPGVEEDGAVVYARLPACDTPFRADPVDDLAAQPAGVGGPWRLSLIWPLRASAEQIRAWNAQYPQAPMDLWQGETRVSFSTSGLASELEHWVQLAEGAVAQMVRWRRAQRAPGEGN